MNFALRKELKFAAAGSVATFLNWYTSLPARLPEVLERWVKDYLESGCSSPRLASAPRSFAGVEYTVIRTPTWNVHTHLEVLSACLWSDISDWLGSILS